MSATANIRGNMGKPYTLSFTPSGRPVGNFSVADTPRRKNPQTNEWEDAGETLWVDVAVWGEDAELLAEKFEGFKGQVTVAGRLGIRTFQRNDGTEGKAVTLTADSVMFHAPRKQSGNSNPNAGQFNQPRVESDPWAGQQQGGGWNAPAGGDNEPPF